MNHLSAVSPSLSKVLVALFTALIASHASAFDSKCLKQWNASSAHDSCQLWQLSQPTPGVCEVKAACDQAGGASGYGPMNFGRWTLDSVSKLGNDDGTLTGGEVPPAAAPPAPAPRVELHQ